MPTEYKRVMIFGVFDNLHEGHKFFIGQASSLGSELFIVVAPTKAVEKMKGKLPFYSIKERMHAIAQAFPSARVIEGDNDQNLWSPLKEHRPNLVVCGYDQDKLYNSLLEVKENLGFELTKLTESFRGDEMHSRFINKSV